MASTGECDICARSTTKKLRKLITCPYCQQSACTECVRTHLKTGLEPTCFSCSTVWSTPVLYANLSASFVNKDLFERQVDIVLEQQRRLLPSTTHLVKQHQDYVDELTILTETHRKMVESHDLHKQNWRKQTDKNEKSHTKKIIDTLRLSIKTQQAIIDALNREYNAFLLSNGKQAATPERYVACPTTNCRGFIPVFDERTQHMICLACGKDACIKCGELYDTDHKCSEETLANIAKVKSDSKQCPGCRAYIHRIEGCYQMWCTACHTTFDWKSLRILTERVHNPHYVAYLAQQANGGNTIVGNDQPLCRITLTQAKEELLRRGVVISHNDVVPLLFSFNKYIAKSQVAKFHDPLIDLFVRVPDIEDWLNTQRQTLLSFEQRWTNLRIDYLRKTKSEEQWRKAIRTCLKLRQKITENLQIGTTYCTVAINLQHEFMNGKSAEEVMTAYKDLSRYIRKCFQDVDKQRQTSSKIDFVYTEQPTRGSLIMLQ